MRTYGKGITNRLCGKMGHAGKGESIYITEPWPSCRALGPHVRVEGMAVALT